jgi:predicted TIM-barrel fold metal-dependent hydrolase
VIDVNVLVGASPQLVPDQAYDLAAATQELRRHGVSAALVASRSGAAYRQETGNDLTLDAAGNSGGVRLHPVATLNPVQYLDWPAELERVLAAGATALRFFPDVQGWSIRSEAFQAICRAVRGRCPLLLPVTRFGDASEIGAVTAHLEVAVVLLGAHYTQLGDCLAAVKRWPHLLLETSRLGQFRGVETVVRGVGAGRLLFGSGAPLRPIQAPLNAVLYADITAEDRAAILAANASRVFGIASIQSEVPEPARATGLIDVHGHVGSLGFPLPAVESRAYPAGVAGYGIVHTIASSLRAIVDDGALGNAEAFAAAAGSADALDAYVVVNPNDLEGSCRAMDDAYRHERAIGAKLHCSWSRQPTAGSACLALLREVALRERPLKIHVDGVGWSDALREVAAAFPTWDVIVAHAGPGTPTREAACLVGTVSNVYVELSTSFPDLPVIRDVVRAAQPRHRLLFGSDAPLLEPAYALGTYADAGADLSACTDAAREVFRL